MSAPLEELYFNWLYSKVASIDVPSTPSLTYDKMFRTLHNTEFIWFVTGDDNRAEEGQNLRREFLNTLHLDPDPLWLDIPCSVLEMMYAFAKRLQFQTDESARYWFWHFLENLELDHLSDNWRYVETQVGNALHIFINREYDELGHGGLFPLDYSRYDQRERELWYQFCEYAVD